MGSNAKRGQTIGLDHRNGRFIPADDALVGIAGEDLLEGYFVKYGPDGYLVMVQERK